MYCSSFYPISTPLTVKSKKKLTFLLFSSSLPQPKPQPKPISESLKTLLTSAMNDEHITIVPHANKNQNRFRTFTVSFFETSITTTVTATPAVARSWLFRVRRLHRFRADRLVVGLGVQWNPYRSTYQPAAATLQLCIGRQCLIFQLHHATRVPYTLRLFLADSRNTFVGICNHTDEAMLLRSKHRLAVSRIFDIRHVAAERRGLSRQLSMNKLAEIFLGANDVTKPRTVGVSAWDAYWLTLDQVQYACVDAFISFQVGKALKVWDWDRDE